MQISLAGRLRVLRIERGLTVGEAAEKIGIDRHTLGRVEGGTQRPSGPTLLKIAQGYGVPVKELVEEPIPPKVEAPSPPPELSEEERREELRNIRDLLVDVHALLEGLVQAYQASGDASKLATLLAVAMFVVLGSEQFVKEEVGTEAADRESMRIYTAGARLEELVEDIQEILSATEGDHEPSVVINLSEWLSRREAG